MTHIQRDDLNEEAVEVVAVYFRDLFGGDKDKKPGAGTYLRARQLVARLMASGLVK